MPSPAARRSRPSSDHRYYHLASWRRHVPRPPCEGPSAKTKRSWEETVSYDAVRDMIRRKWWIVVPIAVFHLRFPLTATLGTSYKPIDSKSNWTELVTSSNPQPSQINMNLDSGSTLTSAPTTCYTHSKTDIIFLKHDNSIVRQSINPAKPVLPVGETAHNQTCSIIDNTHTGFDDCLRILLSCFRTSDKRLKESAINRENIQDVVMQWWQRFIVVYG